jgi:hypothetical protein
MKKKGYMFTVDVTLAIIILVIGVLLLYYNYYRTNEIVYFTEQISQDIIGVMAYTNVKDLCNNPGMTVGPCSCPNYPPLEDAALQEIVCSDKLMNNETSLLGMINEFIETGAVEGDKINATIREIFVTNKIIDEKRFGFAILYTKPGDDPLEIYNTEAYEDT